MCLKKINLRSLWHGQLSHCLQHQCVICQFDHWLLQFWSSFLLLHLRRKPMIVPILKVPETHIRDSSGSLGSWFQPDQSPSSPCCRFLGEPTDGRDLSLPPFLPSSSFSLPPFQIDENKQLNFALFTRNLNLILLSVYYSLIITQILRQPH